MKGILPNTIKPINFTATIREYKDIWDLKFSELYNKEPTEKYHCYVKNLGSTIEALLRHRLEREFKIDLSKLTVKLPNS